MDFLDALTFDNPFPPPASSVTRFTDTLTQLPFIPTLQTPNTSSVRSTYWPSPRSSSPLLSSPSPTNTMQDFPVHRGPPTTQVSFQRSYPYNSSPFPHNGSPVITRQHHEAVAPYSQNIAPFRVDFNPASKERKRPPRPSNAFMLFRSDFHKRKLVSKDQETRQHRLSIIVAKCWHRLSKEEKTKWFLEAEREKKRHARKYADYKFQPRRRTKIKCEPKLASPPEEFESLCRLADVAYQEMKMIDDDLARENVNTPSTICTSIPGSPIPSPTPQIDMTERPFSEGYGEWPAFSSSSSAANHSVRGAQIPYIPTGTDAVRDTGAMFSSVSHFVQPSHSLFSYFVVSFVTDSLSFIPVRQISGYLEPTSRNGGAPALQISDPRDDPGPRLAGPGTGHRFFHNLQQQQCSTVPRIFQSSPSKFFG